MPQPFVGIDPAVQRARRAFDRAADAYDDHAVLQQEIGSRLLERLSYFELTAEWALDLGCGTGTAGAELCNHARIDSQLSLDLSMGMLGRAGHREAPTQPVCADMHHLPLVTDSMDLVFSNLSICWSHDEPALYAELARVIQPGGLLLFTTYGPDTLSELRAAWSAVDDLDHVNLHADIRDIGNALVAAGFHQPVMDREFLTLEYSELDRLFQDLRGVGSHATGSRAARSLRGRQLRHDLLVNYPRDAKRGHYPATFEVIYGAAFVA